MSIRYFFSPGANRTHTSKIVSFVLVIILLANTSTAVALTESPVLLKPLKISQETLRRLDGIWILRPKSLDLEIHTIIRLNNIETLEDYSRWLTENIQYQSDGPQDTWTNPLETLFRKFGDCEDYTFLNAYVLTMLGYEPMFVALQRKGQAHAVCVFKVGEYYLWFDNAELKKTKTKSLNDFAKFVTSKHHYSHLFELNLESQEWELVYQK